MVRLSYPDPKIYDRRRWIHHLFLGVLVLRWLVALAFDPLQTKMFAALMLVSVAVVETAIGWRRRNSA